MCILILTVLHYLNKKLNDGVAKQWLAHFFTVCQALFSNVLCSQFWPLLKFILFSQYCLFSEVLFAWTIDLCLNYYYDSACWFCTFVWTVIKASLSCVCVCVQRGSCLEWSNSEEIAIWCLSLLEKFSTNTELFNLQRHDVKRGSCLNWNHFFSEFREIRLSREFNDNRIITHLDSTFHPLM